MSVVREDEKVSLAKSVVKHENAILLVVLLIIAAFFGVLTNGSSLTVGNLKTILLQSAVRGIAAIGQTFVILTGGIDISVGGTGLLSAVICASTLTTGHQNIFGAPIAIGLGILLTLLMGIGVGTINGLSVSKLKMPALIVTLSIWQILRGIAYQMTKGQTIINLPRALAFLGQGELLGIPVPVIIFAILAVIAYFVLYHTTFGRAVYAVGGNIHSAWLSGIKTKNILISVYIISGFLAAIAGVITLSRTMAASLLTLGGLEMETIAVVAIGGISLSGGRGNFIGAVIGLVILGLVNNGMVIVGLNPAFQDLVKGAIIFIAVAIDFIRRRNN